MNRLPAVQPPQVRCPGRENPVEEGLATAPVLLPGELPDRGVLSADAEWCAHTPQNQSPHRPAVDKTRRLPVTSLTSLQRHVIPRDLDPVHGTTDIARWRDACLPAGLPPTSRHSRPRDKWEISREDVKGLPCPIQAGREDEKVVVRLGLSGDDAIRILSQQVPRQHPRRDHGNSPPFPPLRPLARRAARNFPKRTPVAPDGAFRGGAWGAGSGLGVGPGRGVAQVGRARVRGGAFWDGAPRWAGLLRGAGKGADLGLDARTRSGQGAGASLDSSPLPARDLSLREGVLV